MLVFDTSAYLNGWHDHYPPATFPSLWVLIVEALEDGRVVMPREVYRELTVKDDEVNEWAKKRAGCVVEPGEAVQREAGVILAMLPNPGVRDGADPFVVAEAKIRAFKVVTYEGRSFSGVPHKNWSKTMPGICQRVGVDCRTLPEALTLLGARF